MASQQAKKLPYTLPYAELSAIAACFLLNQEIILMPKLKQKPEVFFLALASLPNQNQQNHATITHHLPHTSCHNELCPSSI
jgi:hypothetical protein